jgi:carboxypeptidase Q
MITKVNKRHQRGWYIPLLLCITFINFGCATSGKAQKNEITQNQKDNAAKLIDAALSSDRGFERLTYLGDHFGNRLSGSESLERTIDWILETMKKDGLENVRSQPVMVPHWVRGDEYVQLLSPRERELPMLGLGGSIGTPAEGITAEALVVKSFDELKERSDEAKGKIIVFNAPFTSYGETVRYRVNGAVAAAKVGAVASLIRSVGSYSIQTPHTGVMHYAEGVRKIPHAAITIEDAKMLQRMQDRDEPIKLKLFMEARTLPDAPSRNVLAEIKGSEYPNEVVVLGGHIDSWDVGQGVMDDGGGCVAAWEAVLLMKELGLRPKRTVRVVNWTNEENGLQGGKTYRDSVVSKGVEKHVLAIETDSGVFDPKGFGFSGSDEAFQILKQLSPLLNPIDAGEIVKGGGGADISPLMKDGVPGMGLRVDGSKYFWFHHTDADTIDKLDKESFNKCVATLAVAAYVVADLDQPLPREE